MFKSPERIGPLKVLSLRKDLDVHIFDHHGNGEGAETSAWASKTQRHIEPVGATATLLIERLNRSRSSSLLLKPPCWPWACMRKQARWPIPRRLRAIWKPRRLSSVPAPI